MIVYFCTLWIIILYYIGYNKLGAPDTFSPLKLVTIKMIIMDIPFLLYLTFYPDILYNGILSVCNVDLETAVFNYTIVKTIAYIFLILGIRYSSKGVIGNRFTFFNKELSYKLASYFSLFFFIIGLYYYYRFITDAGGLFYLLNNLTSRTEILNEIAGASQSVNYITLSVILYAYYYFEKKTKFKTFVFIIYIILVILAFSSFGGRKNVLYLIILLLACINYYYSVIKIKKIKKFHIALGTFIISFYILIIPILRSNDGVEKISNLDFKEVIDIENLVTSLSYVYIDIFAINYFNPNNIWGGVSTNDIFINLIKEGGNKELLPPIDDGVYFRTIVDYQTYIVPPLARGKMFNSSWPIENLGYAYANFWIFGVVFFFFIIGIVYNVFYKLLFNNNYHPLYLYLYVFVIFNFNFSNLRLVQFFLLLPLIVVLTQVFKFFEKRNG